MYSTRKSFDDGSSRNVTRSASARLALALSAGLATFGVAGCQTNPPAKPEPYSTATIPSDEAMARRDWPRTTAEFESGATLAGATRFPYAPQTVGDGASYASLGPERSNALLDNLFFIGQSLALPFTYFGDPPFVKKEYRGVLYSPTHYAMPVLPPDEVPDYDAYAPPPLKDDAEADVRADERRDSAPSTGDPSTPRLRDQIRPEPTDESAQPPREVPADVQEPPTITPEGSEPAPGQPGEPVKIEPDATAPEVAPEATAAPEAAPEVTPMPETAPEATPEAAPVPESTEPAPADAPVPDVAPAPEATDPAPQADEAVPAPETTEPAPADQNK